MKTLFCVLCILLVTGRETVNKEEQTRRANQRQTDYTAEINRRRKEAEEKENKKNSPSFWDTLLWGSNETPKEPPCELTEEELKPRRWMRPVCTFNCAP